MAIFVFQLSDFPFSSPFTLLMVASCVFFTDSLHIAHEFFRISLCVIVIEFPVCPAENKKWLKVVL